MRLIYFFVILQVVCSFSVTAQISNLSFGTDTTLDIMTWNIENFPKNGNTTINYVKSIIEELEIDVIAIQEVSDVNSFDQLVNELTDYSGYLFSERFAGLAYIYNPSVIQINQIYEVYTNSSYWNFFPRAPMVMDFNYADERYIVINNHFKCCGDGFLETGDTSDEETRRYNASNLLKEFVDTNFSEENVIILGDLNDNILDQPENNVFQMFIDDSANYLFADTEIALGTNSDWSFPNWPSHLDHILITNELFDEFQDVDSNIQTIKIDDFLPGGFTQYDQNISDHRPVAIKLNVENGLSTTDFSISDSNFKNFPNPFNTTTQFTFNNTTANKIDIYNLNGQKISSLKITNGQSTIRFNAEQLSNGIYIAKLMTENKVMAIQKIVVIN